MKSFQEMYGNASVCVCARVRTLETNKAIFNVKSSNKKYLDDCFKGTE